MQPNARPEPRARAAARHERRLLRVGSRPMLAAAGPSLHQRSLGRGDQYHIASNNDWEIQILRVPNDMLAKPIAAPYPWHVSRFSDNHNSLTPMLAAVNRFLPLPDNLSLVQRLLSAASRARCVDFLVCRQTCSWRSCELPNEDVFYPSKLRN